MSKFNGVKTNNAKTTAKQEIRKSTLALIDDPSVLEVFCGAGEMYNDVWCAAKNYTGIDKVKFFDSRKTICGDALKSVSTIPLDEYNIFDIDAYGSPYDVLKIILDRYQGRHESIGFVITDGVAMDLRLGRICKGLRHFTGINSHIVKKSANYHDQMIKMVIDFVADKLSGEVVGFKIAKGRTGSAMRYYSFVVKRAL